MKVGQRLGQLPLEGSQLLQRSSDTALTTLPVLYDRNTHTAVSVQYRHKLGANSLPTV
jgi:hypothetical protein